MKTRLVYFFLALGLLGVVGAGYATMRKIDYQTAKHISNTDAVVSIENEVADWTFGMLLVSILGLSVSAVGLYWVKETLNATIVSADASVSANQINTDAMQTAERAWIGCDIIVDGPKTYSDDGNWGVNLFIRNTNFGRTHALNVTTRVESSTMSNIEATVAKMKSEIDPMDRSSGILISPGKYFDRPWHFSTDSPIFPKKNLEGIADFIVGCVSYTTVFNPSRTHYTIFVYNISPQGASRQNKRDKMLREQHGDLYLWPWAGSTAD